MRLFKPGDTNLIRRSTASLARGQLLSERPILAGTTMLAQRFDLFEPARKLVLVTAIAAFGALGCMRTVAHSPDASAPSTPGVKATGITAGPEPGITIAEKEIVMSANMQITADTPVGTITITAGQGFNRCYTWEGATGCIELGPQEAPWLGLAAEGNPFLWRTHNGINRIVVIEGQQHFSSVDEFKKWTGFFRRGYFKRVDEPLVYRDDGLLVGWSKVLARCLLDVDVRQIYIDGRKPDKLPGSQNDKISVRMVSALPHDDLSKWLYLF